MQFLEVIIPSPKTSTIIYNFCNFFPFSKNLDYHMQFLEFHSLLEKQGLSYVIFMEFLSLLQKCGVSYAIFGIYFPSPKTWTIICNFWIFYPFSKNMDYHMQFLEFFLFSKNMDYHMQFQEFPSLLQKHGLSYIIYRISFTFPKTCTIICMFHEFLTLLH